MKKFYIVTLMWSSLALNAQRTINNKGSLQIFPGASLTVFENFANESTASFTNNGSFYVKGNLTNDQASMVTGTGTLYINGSTAQTISGLQKFRTYNLVTNNSSGFILNQDLSVAAAHTFSAGVIATSATPNYLIYESGSSYSGDGDSKHVNGWVKKIGNTNFIFPVGNGTVERTIALNSLSAASEFNVKYAQPTPNFSHTQLPVQSMDPNEYWTVNKISGGSATVAMNWNNSKVTFPNWLISEITTASYNGSLWTDAGGTAIGNPGTTGTIVSNSISAFNLFAFGSKAFPIPVTLVSFGARRIAGYTVVSWTTVNEHDVDHFLVERSDNNVSFYPVGQLPARNSGNPEAYSMKDMNAVHTIAYYRLKSIDVDGKFKYSKVVSVKETDNSQLTLLSNPVTDKLSLIAGKDLQGEFAFFVYNSTGQMMQRGNLNISNGSQQEIILKDGFAKGEYWLNVFNSSRSFTLRFIKD